MRERLDLRRQDANDSIESFARDIKLIGHRAYPKAADPPMLEHILIKQFVNGLSNEVSRERVILKALKTLTEAAQFARLVESAVRVARNYSTASPTPCTVSSLSFKAGGSSSGPSGFASRPHAVDYTFCGFRGRGRGRLVKRGAFNSDSRASSSGPKFGQNQQQDDKAIKCFNCRS